MCDLEFYPFQFDLNTLVMMLARFLPQAINQKELIFKCNVSILTSLELLADDGRLVPLPRLSALKLERGDCTSNGF
jgi:hypothetical protein